MRRFMINGLKNFKKNLSRAEAKSTAVIKSNPTNARINKY
jgi:hypothetical protein